MIGTSLDYSFPFLLNASKTIKFGDLPSRGKINPLDVRFSQNSISSNFQNGNSVSDLTKGLKNGTILPDNIPQ